MSILKRVEMVKCCFNPFTYPRKSLCKAQWCIEHSECEHWQWHDKVYDLMHYF